MFTILRQWHGLSAISKCRSEMCCMWLAENTGRKKIAKNSPSAHHRTNLLGCIFATKPCIDNRKKLLKSNVSSICPHNMANGWDCFDCLGHPSKFQRVSRLAFITATTSLNGGQPNFARCLAVSWAGTLYIHFGALAPEGILPGAKFTLRPSLAFSYIISVTAQHSSRGRQPNFVAWYKKWNYGTFADCATYIRLGGHHIGNQPNSF